MEIYKAPQADLFRAFLKNDAATVGARQNILSAPPLYTMPEDLLGRILKRSGISAADAESINATLKQQTENIEQILTANTVIDELPHVSKKRSGQAPSRSRFQTHSSKPPSRTPMKNIRRTLKPPKYSLNSTQTTPSVLRRNPRSAISKFKSTKTSGSCCPKAKPPPSISSFATVKCSAPSKT